jgi:hypothetical protein
VACAGGQVSPGTWAPAVKRPALFESVEVRDGASVAVERATWPDGTPMIVIGYRLRGSDGAWTHAVHRVAIPARVAVAVADLIRGAARQEG